MSAQPEKLHIGCGGFAPEGWLNTDGSWHVWLSRHKILKRMAIILNVVPKEHSGLEWPESIIMLDVRHPLPFKDNSFRAVYSSHLLEHLHRDEALRLLKEVYRVCVNGAVVRTIVPNLAILVERYLSGIISPRAPGNSPADTFINHLGMRSPLSPKGNLLRRLYHAAKDFNSHKWAYDEKSLNELYREAGFHNPMKRQVHDSDIEDIAIIEKAERHVNELSLIIEARKELISY